MTKSILYIRAASAIMTAGLLCTGTGCRSVAEEVAYHHSDEKKQGMTQWEYDMMIQRRLEEMEEEEAQFNMMRNQ